MADFTKPYFKAYDAIRTAKMNITGPLDLLDDTAQVVETIASGWLPRAEPPNSESAGLTVMHVLDRAGDDFPVRMREAFWFVFEGVRYERVGAEPLTATGNPREWQWTLRKVGRE